MEEHFFIDARMAAGDSPPTLLFFDFVGIQATTGRGITASDVAAWLAENRSAPRIDVRINSTGGNAADGLAIFNSLRQFPGFVTTYCDGFALSAAALLFLAGRERLIAPGSQIMVHSSSLQAAAGNAERLRRTASDLERLDESVAGIMADRTGQTKAQMLALMKAETWMDDTAAIAKGFATGRSIENPQMAATVDLSGFRNVPAAALSLQASGELPEVFRVDARPVPAVDAGERFRIVP